MNRQFTRFRYGYHPLQRAQKCNCNGFRPPCGPRPCGGPRPCCGGPRPCCGGPRPCGCCPNPVDPTACVAEVDQTKVMKSTAGALSTRQTVKESEYWEVTAAYTAAAGADVIIDVNGTLDIKPTGSYQNGMGKITFNVGKCGKVIIRNDTNTITNLIIANGGQLNVNTEQVSSVLEITEDKSESSGMIYVYQANGGFDLRLNKDTIFKNAGDVRVRANQTLRIEAISGSTGTNDPTFEFMSGSKLSVESSAIAQFYSTAGTNPMNLRTVLKADTGSTVDNLGQVLYCTDTTPAPTTDWTTTGTLPVGSTCG